jgi:hypothetical protein
VPDPLNLRLYHQYYESKFGVPFVPHSDKNTKRIDEQELMEAGIAMMRTTQAYMHMVFTKRGCIHRVYTPPGVFKIARNIITDACLYSLQSWMHLHERGCVAEREVVKYATLGITNQQNKEKLVQYIQAATHFNT